MDSSLQGGHGYAKAHALLKLDHGTFIVEVAHSRIYEDGWQTSYLLYMWYIMCRVTEPSIIMRMSRRQGA